MVYVSLNDSIEMLPLSANVKNCLRRAKTVKTVKDFMLYPPDKWQDVHFLGKVKHEEILQCIEGLKSGYRGYILYENDLKLLDAMSALAKDNNNDNDVIIRFDTDIEKLSMSNRTLNLLKRHGIFCVEDLIKTLFEELQKLPYTGVKIEDELLAIVTRIRDSIKNTPMEATTITDIHQQIITKITKKLILPLSLEINTIALKIKKEHPDCNAKQFEQLFLSHPILQNSIKETILAIINTSVEGLTLDALTAMLPENIDPDILNKLISELEKSNKIIINSEIISKPYLSVYDYAQQIPHSNCRKYILDFLTLENAAWAGKGLSEATKKNLQSLAKRYFTSTNCPPFREKKYFDIYEKYYISEEQFLQCFEETLYTYRYFMLISERKRFEKKPFSEIVSDEFIPLQIREKAEEICRRDRISLKGQRHAKRRSELIKQFIKDTCQSATRIETIVNNYIIWLGSLALADELTVDVHSLEAMLNRSDFCLLSYPRKYRYYAISEQDFSTLLSGINLEQYKDIEISSLKLFRDNLALMQEYDIKDEYELYSLLKKIVDTKKQNIVFSKMPTIEIGVIDRDKQVYDLFRKNDPISIEDFCLKYEAEYGVKSQVVRSNYINCLKKYYKNGLYINPIK